MARGGPSFLSVFLLDSFPLSSSVSPFFLAPLYSPPSSVPRRCQQYPAAAAAAAAPALAVVGGQLRKGELGGDSLFLLPFSAEKRWWNRGGVLSP